MGMDLDRAAALHRSAAAVVTALDQVDAAGGGRTTGSDQHEVAEQLRSLAARLAPGWWGAPLDAQTPTMPMGGLDHVGHLRIGIAQPLDDARFPVVVPFLGSGHLTLDGDIRDRRVAGLLRAVLLRLLAAVPPERVSVRTVDGVGAAGEDVLGPFRPLTEAGVLRPAATDVTGLRAALAEAEQWIRPARPTVARHHRQGRFMLLIIASLPELTDGVVLDRIARLAQVGPEHGLHLVVAGWPPPPLDTEQTRADLPCSTMVRLRNPYVLVGDPPGDTFRDLPAGAGGDHLGGLDAPVYLDRQPPQQLIDQVCAELVARSEVGARPPLTDLLPDPADGTVAGSAADGLVAAAGFDGHRPVLLRFNDITPHWLVAGQAGAEVDQFLTALLYGLAVRHDPAEVTLHLVDLSPGESFTSVLPGVTDPSGLPHIATAGVDADPEYGLSVLRQVAAEVDRRSFLATRNGTTRFAELAAATGTTRVLCVLKDPAPMLDLTGPVADESLDLLERIARGGRGSGVHLLIADSGTGPAPGSEQSVGSDEPDGSGGWVGSGCWVGPGPAGGSTGGGWWRRDSLLSQFPVRVVLAGGDWLLEPSNDAAVGLPTGRAVVNTAGGLGGPRGATRGHERTVVFPDPYTDRPGLAGLRRQLWSRRAADARPPQVFAGYLQPELESDETYQRVLADPPDTPAGLFGRAVELPGRTAEFRFERAPGRHLAIFGSRESTASLLATVVRSAAAHHQPGTARILLLSMGEHDRRQLTDLARAVGVRQPTEVVDLEVLRTLGDAAGPAYLVIATADVLELGGPAAARLRNLLDSGPARGIHLLSGWEQPDSFLAFLGPSPDLIAGIVLLDRPVTEQAATAGPVGFAGRLPAWHPRPQRGLLYDAQTDRRTVFVPFQPAGTGTDTGEGRVVADTGEGRVVADTGEGRVVADTAEGAA